MSDRKLTVTPDEDLVRAARVLAADEGTSLGALVTRLLRQSVARAVRYRRARESALRALAEVEDRGGASWTRAELHERRARTP